MAATAKAIRGAGELRTRITIQEKVDASDGQGGTTHTWGGAGHEWPAWSAKAYFVRSGGDVIEADQTVSRKRFDYTIRRRKDVVVTQAMRVVDGTMTLAIIAVVEDDTDRTVTVLTCEEVPT